MVLEWWCDDSPYADKDGIICDGSIRAGKTTAMALSYVLWAMDNFEEENFAFCGKTINSLRRNVIKQLKRILISRGFKYKEHRSENYITITFEDVSNDFYLFGGKDEASQDLIQGITLAGVFFDEVALMPESFVNQAVGRCSVEGSKFWFNCNPDSPNHYFKKKWIDKLSEKNLIRIHFTMEDNPSLSRKTIERYKSLFTGVFFDRFILGLWVMAEGLIYSMYEDSFQEPPDGKPDAECLSIDYGTMNAFAAIIWAKYGATWYATNEYYYSGRDTGIQKTDEEYLKDLNEFIGSRTNLETIIDPSAASFIALLRKSGKYTVKKADNAVLDGIRMTATALKTGKIKIAPWLVNWRDEAASYIWDEKATNEDAPVKEKDHLMDAMRYFVKTKRIGMSLEGYKPKLR